MSSFVAKRLKGAGLPLPQVLPAIAQLLVDWQLTPPLCYAGSLPIQIELSESGIASYLAWLDQARAIGIPKGFFLFSHDYNPQITLFIDRNEFDNTESITFSIPSDSSKEVIEINYFYNLVAQICSSFSAYQGYVYDELLACLHERNKRIVKKQFAQTPSGMHQFIPAPVLVEKVVDALPPLLLKNEFDSRRVPNGIWWVNFWEQIQVETVGITQIKSASWFKLVELSEEVMILIATEEQINVKNPIHLLKLSKFVEHLHLREIQEHYILTNH